MDHNHFCMNSPIKIAIFASGNGTNMQAIADYLAMNPGSGIRIALIVSDNPSAYVLERARGAGIPSRVLSPEERRDSGVFLGLLKEYGVRYIVLAGYLRRVPAFLVEAYRGRILNIHPALLPKHGGKGMYGDFVHSAVKAAGDRVTGITIHEADEEFDHGKVVFQAETEIDPDGDSIEEIARKVHLLEHRYYPTVIAEWIHSKEA